MNFRIASCWFRPARTCHLGEGRVGDQLFAGVFSLSLLLMLVGCGTSRCAVGSRSASTGASPLSGSNHDPRQFDFKLDTFSFSNQLAWLYTYDAQGKWTTTTRKPRPPFTQHCFILARAVRQFFLNARFDPEQNIADEAVYRRLIREVLYTNPRRALPADEKIIIPGYSDLRSFSEAQEKLLKAESGAGWRSYVQRGHWRIVFPFSRRHQEQMAEQLVRELTQNAPVVVHVVRFPQLTINHAIALYSANVAPDGIDFLAYDPNRCDVPVHLQYDRSNRRFNFVANDYFPGGRVDVYEVYHRWNY